MTGAALGGTGFITGAALGGAGFITGAALGGAGIFAGAELAAQNSFQTRFTPRAARKGSVETDQKTIQAALFECVCEGQ